jgi:hypothetical protein
VLKGTATRWITAAAGSGLLFVAAFVMGPGVAAQTAAPPTVTVGQNTTLFADILSKVPVTITCAPRTPQTAINASVGLEQAVNGHIAYGSNSYSQNSPFGTGGPFPSPVACDNTAHRFLADVMANTAGVPFSSGQAIVTVSVQVCTFDPNTGQQADCATTNVGPRVINQVSA